MMKTSLFALALLATTVCSAQFRVLENTVNSWNYQNLSVETYNNFVISGTTDRGPNNRLCPLFKFTSPALNPLFSYYVDFPQDVYLMDFTINTNTGNLVITGMTPGAASSGGVMQLYLTEIDFMTGCPVNPQTSIMQVQVPYSAIPHQVIYSPVNNQVAVVGTEVNGVPTPTNYTALSKNGFVTGFNANDYTIPLFHIQTNTPSSNLDNDMLESITEFPGTGYFVGGSANNTANPNEQNMHIMSLNYGGGVTASSIIDNTTVGSAVASVMYNAPTGQAIVLANNAQFRRYEVFRSTFAATFASPSFSHVIGGLPANAVVNGFRLQQDGSGNQVMIGGYIMNLGGALLTPFQLTTNPGLSAVVSVKTFQSGNNSPLTGYFNESGASVYINTPDMLAYHPSNRTFLVNPNTVNQGFDLYQAFPAGGTTCEVQRQATTTTVQKGIINKTMYQQTSTPVTIYQPNCLPRQLKHTTLCGAVTTPATMDEAPIFDMAAAVKLFPNPAKDQLTIESGTVLVEAAVYDLKGNQVLAASNSETSGIRQLDISLLQPGVYILSLTDAQGTLVREKFVKE